MNPSTVDATPPDPGLVEDFLIAAALQQRHKIRYYIESVGLHPDTTRASKPTALCYASLKPNFALIDYYLDKGADVNHADAIGMTPLHYAAMGGCVMCVVRLLQEGAQINRPNRKGETPLAAALNRAGAARCAELLRAYGARIAADTGDEVAAVSPRFH